MSELKYSHIMTTCFSDAYKVIYLIMKIYINAVYRSVVIFISRVILNVTLFNNFIFVYITI